MLTLWKEEVFKYDGTQLKPLWNYLEHGLLGTSCVAWRGPCEVSFEQMKDGEDLRDASAIRGDEMLHFIFEIFDEKLFAGVSFQRLVADLARSTAQSLGKGPALPLLREGDDVWSADRSKKLSISVAIPTLNSTLIHYAVNVTNRGTPVPTLSLEDLQINPKTFAEALMKNCSEEYLSIRQATWKVRS